MIEFVVLLATGIFFGMLGGSLAAMFLPSIKDALQRWQTHRAAKARQARLVIERRDSDWWR